jgi:preprotein translocase subunit SecG
MYILFTILIVIASILLTLLVLVQNSKGGGLASGFASSNQVLGVRKTTDFLEKATWTLVAVVLLLSVGSVAVDKNNVASNESEIKEQYQNAQKDGACADLPAVEKKLDQKSQGAGEERTQKHLGDCRQAACCRLS